MSDTPAWLAFGFSIICGIVSIAVAYGMLTTQARQMRSELSRLWEWKDHHEKEAETKRYEFAKDLEQVRLDHSESKGFLKAIMDRLERIERLLEKGFKGGDI